MNENRGIFTLDGVTGMLIATVLLLSILVFLTFYALRVQHTNSDNFYKVENEKSIKVISTDNAKHIVDVK
jgi:hypothetical protein